MINQTLKEAETKMAKAIEVTREEFTAIRAGRAHPSMFSKLTAEYYGSPTPLQQLASFTQPEARVIMIAPYDMGSMSAIEKSIRESDLGINPSNDGKVLRCVFPELTEERRRELVKVAKGKGEDAKVSIRSIRRHAKDALDKLVKDGETGEDDVRRAEGELDKMTSTYTTRVDEAVKAKESELLEV